MSYRQHSSVLCTILTTLLLGLLLLNACSSSPSLSVAKSTPATNSTASLDISVTLPPASVGSAYNGDIAVTGGTAPYNFSLASGQLPTGVELSDTTGKIAGTPSAAGSFNFAVSVSDSKGLSEQQTMQLKVSEPTTTSGGGSNPGGSASGSPPATPNNGGTSISNLQHANGWGQYGQRGPNYVDCSPSPCDGISFWMAQGVTSPSTSGDATEFNLGGTPPFADALWNNHLIGPFSSQGMLDADQKIVPSLQNFTYDVYFFGDNLSLPQALEFDINQFFGGMGFIFGHECRLAAGNEWDVWDNQHSHWTHTGIPCNPNNNAWNHLTIKVQRTSDNDMVYQSITLNGVTSNLNWTFGHGSAPNWYGITINYQMDGNEQQDSYSVYLDNLTFSYQ